jgi:hypothetical protein
LYDSEVLNLEAIVADVDENWSTTWSVVGRLDIHEFRLNQTSKLPGEESLKVKLK